MPRSLFTGASGMAAQQTNVDVISNNIANVSTVGFKKQRADFQDLFYEILQAPGVKAGNAGRNPAGIQIGHGVRVSATPRIFTVGTIEQTGVETDMAIEGDGFFRVSLQDGTEAYTRAGDFRIDADGSLVSPDGYYLEPRVTIPDGAQQISVGTDGEVIVLVDGSQQTVGQVLISTFRNPTGLVGIGRNLFLETEASGSAEEGTPGTTGFGLIRSSALEKSNVDVVVELVNLILAQRAYELNSRTISTSDEMLRAAAEIGA
ncbi:MAG: flagellar basal-body rod protein FlgG [Planctomycetota bacterium]|jgi:flagellar basal-body rod protein FlgG|nr:flagellar basal-body rod protein FlgG [Planctomycetota bacterium]